MNHTKEQAEAIDMLNKVLETQPGVVERKTTRLSGKEAAEFCITFIETYSNWLKQNNQKTD